LPLEALYTFWAIDSPSAIEALGAQETFEACLNATLQGGAISVIGYFGKGDIVDMDKG
jgi:threonine dehydrogenase-like Zn-dependent dehydrogenase